MRPPGNFVYLPQVRGLLMEFQDVAFLPPELVFTPHFLQIAVPLDHHMS